MNRVWVAAGAHGPEGGVADGYEDEADVLWDMEGRDDGELVRGRACCAGHFGTQSSNFVRVGVKLLFLCLVFSRIASLVKKDGRGQRWCKKAL